jgi:hypothetical protein
MNNNLLKNQLKSYYVNSCLFAEVLAKDDKYLQEQASFQIVEEQRE